MTEDLEFTDMMVQPLKTLNLDFLVEELQNASANSKYEQLHVVFSPLHYDEYLIKDNNLIINFFRVKPDDMDETLASVDGKDMKEYIKEKLQELLAK